MTLRYCLFTLAGLVSGSFFTREIDNLTCPGSAEQLVLQNTMP